MASFAGIFCWVCSDWEKGLEEGALNYWENGYVLDERRLRWDLVAYRLSFVK